MLGQEIHTVFLRQLEVKKKQEKLRYIQVKALVTLKNRKSYKAMIQLTNIKL